MPLAAHGVWHGETLSLRVALGHAQTPAAPLLRAQASAAVYTDDQARALGEHAAQVLRDAGAAGYLGAAGPAH